MFGVPPRANDEEDDEPFMIGDLLCNLIAQTAQEGGIEVVKKSVGDQGDKESFCPGFCRLSRDGSTVACGGVIDEERDGRAGQVRVFELVSRSSSANALRSE